MESRHLLYFSIWCPVDRIRGCIDGGKSVLKSLADSLNKYGNREGITFLELTEEALKNLPPHMVCHMGCFDECNIDTSVFFIHEIICNEHKARLINRCFEDHILQLNKLGFMGEALALKEVKVQENNAGRIVGKRGYEVYCHKKYE